MSAIGLIDSGVGGMSVLWEIQKLIPGAKLIYVADEAFFPYGLKEPEALKKRLIQLTHWLIEKYQIKLLVLPCNTASVVGLHTLRQHFSIPIVGTVPGIKPAVAKTKTRNVAILATHLTIESGYLNQLMEEFGEGVEFTCIKSSVLVEEAEKKMKNLETDQNLIKQELLDIVNNLKIDTVVLACTHFPLLLDELKSAVERSIEWIDTSEAIARRVSSLISVSNKMQETIFINTLVEKI